MSTLTKVFIVLQLVLSLVVTVMVVLFVSTQTKYKDQVDGEVRARIAAQAGAAKLQNDLATNDLLLAQVRDDLRKARESETTKVKDLRAEVAAAQKDKDLIQSQSMQKDATIANLTTTIEGQKTLISNLNDELTKTRPANLDLVKKNAELNRANIELTQRVSSAEQAIRRLKEALSASEEKATPTTGGAAAAPAGGGQVTPMAGGLQTTSPVNGKVARVADERGRTYITMGLGTRDGVREGTQFVIYRGNKYIGDAVVRRATVDQSVAQVTITKDNAKVQEGDLVISGIGNQ